MLDHFMTVYTSEIRGWGVDTLFSCTVLEQMGFPEEAFGVADAVPVCNPDVRDREIYKVYDPRRGVGQREWLAFRKKYNLEKKCWSMPKPSSFEADDIFTDSFDGPK